MATGATQVTLERMTWCPELVAGLGETLKPQADFDGVDGIRRGIESGQMEAWKINGGESYAVTQAWDGILAMWCYRGCRLSEVVQVFRKIAASNGMTELWFATLKPGLVRMLRKFNPVEIEPGIYRIDPL